MKKLSTRKMMKKIQQREKKIKLDKIKIRHYVMAAKKKMLSPFVVGGSALVAGLTLGWMVPERFRHLHSKSVAVVAASAPAFSKVMKPRHSMFARLRNGAAFVSSLTAIAGILSRRRH